jgi:hypothetical protein
MIVCALDPAFVREVGVEVESTVTEIRRTMDLRDGSLRGLMTLLAVEADTGGLSGKLYAEHLATHSRFDFYGFLEERISLGIRILERCQTACFSAFLTE